jgi:uncharacterized membrane protein
MAGPEVGPPAPLAGAGGAAMVRARPAPVEPLARLNFRERVSTSLWFVPALFVAGAFVLSKLTVALDRTLGSVREPWWLLVSTGIGAEALASTVATAMLAFLAIVFSTTLIAVQLAGGQYSQRVIRIFVRRRLTHLTLGVFLATFVFALNALIEIRVDPGSVVPRVTVSLVYLLVLVTLATFITFLHGMVRMLRVQYLLHRVTADGRAAMLRAFPEPAAYQESPAPDASAPVTVRSRVRTGVLQSVDRAALVRLAAERQVWVELRVKVGEYVALGTPVADVHGAGAPAVSGDDVVARFLLGGERTLIQDPGFAVRQLVDVAIRALSPAVNDPTTAVQATDHIVDLLSTLAPRPDPTGWYLDQAGAVRLRCQEPGLADLMTLGFAEIIRYGADSPQVSRRLWAAFEVLDGLVRPDARPAIQRLRAILDTTQAARLPAGFAELGSQPDRRGLG